MLKNRFKKKVLNLAVPIPTKNLMSYCNKQYSKNCDLFNKHYTLYNASFLYNYFARKLQYETINLFRLLINIYEL